MKKTNCSSRVPRKKVPVHTLWIHFHSYAPSFSVKLAPFTLIYHTNTQNNIHLYMLLIFVKLYGRLLRSGEFKVTSNSREERSPCASVSIFILIHNGNHCVYNFIFCFFGIMFINIFPKFLHCLHSYCLSDYDIIPHWLMYHNSLACRLILGISIWNICDYQQGYNGHLCIVCYRMVSLG